MWLSGLGECAANLVQKGTKYMVFTRMMEGWKPTRCSQQSSADPNLFSVVILFKRMLACLTDVGAKVKIPTSMPW